jgi:hypothetical protein
MSKDEVLGQTDASPRAMTIQRWPPPGLERMQGDLLAIAQRAGLAGILLTLPLLLIAAREQDFASLGPFADAWWVPLFLLTVGLAVALDALARLARALHRSAHALRGGYDPATILHVLADGGHDTGFLLAGARHFSVLGETERRAVVTLRLVAALATAGAGVWMILSVTLGLFAAARGALTPAGLRLLTLAPAVVFYVVGAAAALVQEGRVRRARRVWHRQPWAEDMTSDEIRAWQAAGGLRPFRGAGSVAGVLGASGFAVAALALPVVLAALTLASASVIAPILTTIAMPSFDTYRQRVARVEAYRTYAIEGDVSVSPEQAGQLLHDLMFVGDVVEEVAGRRPPSRTVDRSWMPAENPFELEPFTWADSLLDRAVAGITREQRDFLRQIDAHPAWSDFSRLARASTVDAGRARWDLPFAPGTTMATVPIPNFRSFRLSAYAAVGAAALDFVEGREDEAENRLREVIAVGFLLVDDGPTLIDNLVGVATVEAGGRALASLYRLSGRTAAAAELSRLVDVADRTAAMMPTGQPRTAEAYVRALPDLVLDTSSVRGLRWEYFINLATIAPCMNVHRMVFGSDDGYAEFVEEARGVLVRWPSDEALFDLARSGWVGAGDDRAPSAITRLASLYMSTGENSCAHMLRDMGAAGAL